MIYNICNSEPQSMIELKEKVKILVINMDKKANAEDVA